jgi:hypothetical protein
MRKKKLELNDKKTKTILFNKRKRKSEEMSGSGKEGK